MKILASACIRRLDNNIMNFHAPFRRNESKLWLLLCIIFSIFIGTVINNSAHRLNSGNLILLASPRNTAASQAIFQNTKDLVDSSIFGTIQNVYSSNITSRQNVMTALSTTDGFIDGKVNNLDQKLNSWKIFKRNETQPKNMVYSIKENGSYPEDDFFLGYSNNMFGSHTQYIKEMAGDPRFYASNAAEGQPRRKRSVLHLYNMVLCATGCNPLSYKGYGCYCGFLGSGYVVDGIDRCCKIHDWCYDTSGCPMFFEYFVPYLWKCYNHHYPVCAIDHGEFGGPGSCSQRLCECDRQLAQCLKMYPCPTSKALCTSSPWRLLQNIFMN